MECCSNLTWCTNPQGCDQILCKENTGSMATCSKCCWSSCFSCNFPEVRGHLTCFQFIGEAVVPTGTLFYHRLYKKIT